VNWTLFISFLVGHRLFVPSAAGAGGFALGVGLGVFSWFTLLIELADRWRSRAGSWVSRSTIAAGVLLVGFGLYFTYRSFKVP
jgi:threonine/homoserine/homoserine lactone efflux protein